MPRKNSRKTLFENGYYHIYNRGVAKQEIFRDNQDYGVFLRFLKEYLLPLDHPDLRALHKLAPRRNPTNCSSDVKLLVYCLMPNHFHLLLKNVTEKGLEKFMRAVGTNYAMYFNKRYERVGPLYQGVYRAVQVETDEQLVYLSKYIHTNPKKLMDTRVRPLYEYSYSSYQNYLNQRHQGWLDTKEILSFFSNHIPTLSYKSFIEETEATHLSVPDLSPLLLEDPGE